MDAVATLSSSAKENTGGNDPMSDDDVLASLLRGQAVQKDVQDALSSLASALFSAWNPEVLATVKHRFQERAEACARVVKAAEAAKIENEGRARSEEAHLAKEDALRREVKRVGNALKAAEETTTAIKMKLDQAIKSSKQEISKWQEKAGLIAKDAKDWQRKAEAGESRLESKDAELSALHEAMAGLHGEMGAVQREVDEAKAAQDKLATDLVRAEGKARKSDEAFSTALTRAKDAEKRLRKETADRIQTTAKLTKVADKTKADDLALAAEVSRLRDSEASHRNGSDKLSATNRDLNDLLQRLSADLENTRVAAEADAKRADASTVKAGEKEEEAGRFGEALGVAESRLAASNRHLEAMKEQMKKASADGQAMRAEVDRQRGELDLLEREKHDLIMDVQERVRALKETTVDVERYKELAAEAEKLTVKEKSEKLAAETREKKALDDLSEANRATAMQDERIEALRSELSTLRRTLEQTSESAKARDKESAQRLVQLSQANAKLSSEGTSIRAKLGDAEEIAEKSAHKLEDAAKEFEKSEESGRRAAESVQRLEEELEVADARWKAAQAQLTAAERREKRLAEEARQKLNEALDLKKKEVDDAVREAEINAERRALEAEASQRTAERTHQRALVSVRDEGKRRLAEEEARRARDVSEARRKSSAVVGALQSLQGELRDSEAKECGLQRQVAQLSARMNRTNSSTIMGGGGGGGVSSGRSGGIGDSGGGGSDAGSRNGGGEDSLGTRGGSEVIVAEIASLRRQVKAATEAKEAAEKGATDAQSRAEEEARKRSSLDAALCRKEAEMVAALGRLDACKLRLQEAEESGREVEEDLRALVRQRESEIENLSRRNQVISDALSRLTSSEGNSSESGMIGTPIIEKIFSLPVSNGAAGGRDEEHGDSGGRGFPAIPRLGRGRELAVSLGESWHSASASSFSPSPAGFGVNSLIGVESSLSVLADSGAGFEPPSPPVDHNLHNSQDQGTAWLPKDDIRTVEQSRHRGDGTDDFVDNSSTTGGALLASTDQSRGSGSGYGVDVDVRSKPSIESSNSIGSLGTNQDGDFSSTPQGHRSHNVTLLGASDRNVGGPGVLHGLSAATASGALPPTTTRRHSLAHSVADVGGSFQSQGNGEGLHSMGEKTNERASHRGSGSIANEGGGDVDADRCNRGPVFRADSGRNRVDERGSLNERKFRTIAGDDFLVDSSGGDGGISGRQKDDGGERARRHIDQALRERARQRRYSGGEDMVELDAHNSTAGPRLPNNDHSADAAFPTRLRSEFPAGASSILGGAEEARFINLDALAQRNRGKGSKQSLLAQGGRRVARVKSTALSAAHGYGASTATKSAAERVYGTTQHGR